MLHTLQSTSNPTLEEIARLGAERMLAMALEAEIQAFIEQYSSIKNAQKNGGGDCVVTSLFQKSLTALNLSTERRKHLQLRFF
ncbi:hypothetical protein CR163_011060 [Prosthecochloris sp. ZM_2]|nr:hypothetical protein CR163_011060 [Prosthecochloris sp. ZM_2]